MRYLLILSFLLIGCNVTNTYEQEALRESKRITTCEEPRIAVSGKSGEESHFIKVNACGRFMDFICVSEGPWACQPVRCVYLRKEPKPMEDGGKTY